MRGGCREDAVAEGGADGGCKDEGEEEGRGGEAEMEARGHAGCRVGRGGDWGRGNCRRGDRSRGRGDDVGVDGRANVNT